MEVKWTGKALGDLAGLYDFPGSVDKRAAGRAVQALTAAPVRLLEHPRMGEKLDEFEPREVRRIVVGRHEIRYEIQESTIYVLRLCRAR